MEGGKGRRVRRMLGALAVAGAFALVAACGSGGGAPAQAPQPASGGAQPAGGTAAAPKQPVQLNVGTTNTTSSFYAYWVAVGKAVNERLKGEVQLNIIESGSTVDNINRMRRGEFHFGNAALATIYQAYNGLGNFSGDRRMPELRWFWSFAYMPYLVLVREDAGITNVEQLHGKPFSGGDIGSGSFLGVQQALSALGVEPRWVKGSFTDGANAVKDGQAVGMSKLVPGVRAREALYMDIMSRVKVRFVGLTAEQEKKVREKFPYYTWYDMPPGVYPAQDYGLRTWGDLAGGVVSSRLPQDVGYRIVKAVFETKDQQASAFDGAREVDFLRATLLADPYVPLHAGTVQYLRERGVQVPAHLIPPEYKP